MAQVANLGSYSPEDVTVVLAHPEFTHQVSGFADGTFISYTRDVPRAKLYVGADLSAGRVLRRNKSGTVNFTLHQLGESNDFFSELGRVDEEDHGNRYLFSITIKDNQGRSVFFAPQAFLATDPDVTYGTDVEMREWSIQVINVERHVGGNSKFSPENLEGMAALGYTPDEKWTQ